MTKAYMAIFAASALVSMFVGVAGLMTLNDFGEELDYEPESQFRDMFVMGFKVRGIFPGVEDFTADEVFDSKRSVMSWNDDGSGQKIIVQGQLIGGAQAGNPGLFRYCFAIKTAGGVKIQADITQGPNKGAGRGDETKHGEYYNIVGFQVMDGLNADGCWAFEHTKVAGVTTNMKAFVTQIHGAGIPHGSVIRVRIEHWGTSFPWEAGRWELGATDEALLMTGLGHITKDREGNYEVGETALITVTISYVKSVSKSNEGDAGFGFYLDAYHLGLDTFVTTDTGATINRLLITSTTQTFKIPIKTEYFVLGSMHNQIEFKLFNELYPKDAASTDIVDIREKAPPKPKVSQDKEEYNEGDTVTITWECSPNAKTNLSIVLAKVVAWIGGVEVFRESFPGSNEKNSASFVAPIAGFLDYRVSCIDSAGRGSGNDEVVVIHNVNQNDFCTTNPDHPSCQGNDDPFPLWEVLILMLAILGTTFVIMIAAYLMNSFGIPPQYTIIISIILLVVFLLAIVLLGQTAINRIAEYMAMG